MKFHSLSEPLPVIPEHVPVGTVVELDVRKVPNRPSDPKYRVRYVGRAHGERVGDTIEYSVDCTSWRCGRVLATVTTGGGAVIAKTQWIAIPILHADSPNQK